MTWKIKRELAIGRELAVVCLAAVMLWSIGVTAGSETAAEALSALQSAYIAQVLRGDSAVEEELSPAAVYALMASPLLLPAGAAQGQNSHDMDHATEIVQTQSEIQTGLQDADSDNLSASVSDNAALEAETIEPVPDLADTEETDSAGLSQVTDFSDSIDSNIKPATENHSLPEQEILQPVENGAASQTIVPTDSDGYTVFGPVYLRNSTKYRLSSEELAAPCALRLSSNETEPQILILHSHGSEAYTPADASHIVWSGEYRTTDPRYNVVNVGDEIANVFTQAGISVLHDRTLYDYPAYSGSYDRSLKAIQNYLEKYPSLRFVLDVHRDAVEDSSGNEYKVLSGTSRGAAAQMTLILGSDGGGLEHSQWRENLKLAAALQNYILSEYPTLMRPMILRNSRYNQHTTTGTLLLEVGAAGNAPEEAALAGRIFAERMIDLLKD